MAIDRLPLNKCLEILQRPRERRLALIERDAKRSVLKKQLGPTDGGRDFYGPFWSDAKQSAVNHDFDLADATAARIGTSKQRRSLYPRLLSGFRSGWTSIRSRTHLVGPLKLVEGVSAKLLERDGGLVRVGNLLVVRDSDGRLCLSYPYFCKDIALGARHARLGLAALQKATSTKWTLDTSIIDVLRGNVFSADGLTFTGDEYEQLGERYGLVLREWKVQRKIHGGR